MAKPIDEIEFKQLAPTLKALARAGGTTEHTDWIRSRGNAAKLIRLIDEQRVASQPSYSELKKAFNWVDGIFNTALFFPIEICKDLEPERDTAWFKLVHLEMEASTEKVLVELEKRGLRPALYQELLVHAAKYPEEQRRLSIAALGSVCRDLGEGEYWSPVIGSGGGDRGLGLSKIQDSWGDHIRFLAVRKST